MATRRLDCRAPAATTSSRKLSSGESYCVRVPGGTDGDPHLNQIVSDWTRLGRVGNPAFDLFAALAAGPTVSPGLTH
jgi:hypothetical protein